ncbi:toll/interleukin-1 receptor domain-containing protein [uncultured Prevotella sp.]|uniref:toll/interleukin-1 receptor domain-containing protein n=1 Tax=uncultured Prevotella sp. TaxID=159272 RepID=UPI0025F631E0|nr:toll/interleukin-1 receptor domain-containing protein [uncultured Prevotella sp.]
MELQFKYYAFISYSSKDTEWGKKVQKKLEHYRMPATLCSEHGWERTPIKPVFFAPTDIQPGGLTEELQERLKSSRNLIVICSPNSAKSEWVGKEIEFFHQLGRTKQIHFFIVDGQPHSTNPDTECFNPIVNTLGLPEILGANIHEKIYRWPWMNKERAYVQLISKLLGVEFDAIWQRHKRLLIRKVALCTIGIIAVISALAGVWVTNQPVDVEVRLNEASVHNDNLPPLEDAIITMTLENETKTDTIHTLDAAIVFSNIPHRFINKEVRMQINCRDFIPVDTTIILSESNTIDIHHDCSVYGNLRFMLWNPDTEQTAPNTEIEIDGHKVLSDDDGYVTITIPLAEQKEFYPISSNALLLENDIVNGHCGPDDIIEFKNQ